MLSALVRPAFSQTLRASRCVPSVSLLARRTVVTTKFTREHEYVTFDSESQVGTIGITDYAQKALGDVVYIELNEVDSEVAIGDQIGAIESVKAASDIYAPVSGTITEINAAVEGDNSLVNKSAEEEGWLLKVKLSNVEELEGLIGASEYAEYCAGEDH